MSKQCKLIYLHGLGSNAAGMQSISDALEQRVSPAESVLLEAPFNVSQGTEAAYGLFTPPADEHRALDDPERKSPSGLEKSVQCVHERIDQFIQSGTSPHDIFLIGHSQGGATAITSGLLYPQTLGGVIAVAGYLALAESMTPQKTQTPFRLHHSLEDDNVSCYWADYARNYMDDLGVPCQVKFWDLSHDPHSVHPCQVEAIAEWINGLCSLQIDD